ncbi:unnamed protein product [Urochloa humidicola]
MAGPPVGVGHAASRSTASAFYLLAARSPARPPERRCSARPQVRGRGAHDPFPPCQLIAVRHRLGLRLPSEAPAPNPAKRLTQEEPSRRRRRYLPHGSAPNARLT